MYCGLLDWIDFFDGKCVKTFSLLYTNQTTHQGISPSAYAAPNALNEYIFKPTTIVFYFIPHTPLQISLSSYVFDLGHPNGCDMVDCEMISFGISLGLFGSLDVVEAVNGREIDDCGEMSDRDVPSPEPVKTMLFFYYV